MLKSSSNWSLILYKTNSERLSYCQYQMKIQMYINSIGINVRRKVRNKQILHVKTASNNQKQLNSTWMCKKFVIYNNCFIFFKIQMSVKLKVLIFSIVVTIELYINP